MKDAIKAVNVRLPKDILNLLDLLIEKGLYSSRSEAMRDFARDFVNSNNSTSTHSTNLQHQSPGQE